MWRMSGLRACRFAARLRRSERTRRRRSGPDVRVSESDFHADFTSNFALAECRRKRLCCRRAPPARRHGGSGVARFPLSTPHIPLTPRASPGACAGASPRREDRAGAERQTWSTDTYHRRPHSTLTPSMGIVSSVAARLLLTSTSLPSRPPTRRARRCARRSRRPRCDQPHR